MFTVGACGCKEFVFKSHIEEMICMFFVFYERFCKKERWDFWMLVMYNEVDILLLCRKIFTIFN